MNIENRNGNTERFTFPYELDPEGPHGIARESWLDRNRIGLVLVDYQNYWLDMEYGSASDIVWKKNSTKNYVFERYTTVILPNTLKLIKKFRDLGLQIIYLRNASFNKELLDIRGVLKKVYAYDLADVRGRPYHMYQDEYASQIIDDLGPYILKIGKTDWIGAINVYTI